MGSPSIHQLCLARGPFLIAVSTNLIPLNLCALVCPRLRVRSRDQSNDRNDNNRPCIHA